MPGVRQELGVPTKWELRILGHGTAGPWGAGRPPGQAPEEIWDVLRPSRGCRTGCGMWGDPGQGSQWEVGVSCAPPSGLGGATPWAPGTKRLCQPRWSVPPCPGNAVTRGPPWCRAPRVAAGGNAGAQPVPAGQRRCQPGPGATAAAAAPEPAATSPLPRPLGFWKMPGNGEPPALIWLRRAGAPRPLSRRAVPCRDPGKTPWAVPRVPTPALECATGPVIPRWREKSHLPPAVPAAQTWRLPQFPPPGSFGDPPEPRVRHSRAIARPLWRGWEGRGREGHS